ncbi:GumC family protein [Pseudoalteromonas luteoviolacea]|uniref:Polysaccharide chain length determinant N-terminal domain-containing protein n=1 Tax=Pseudoalteromonas luteoviolacea NCIMB 1942 TaxID=1365253 RepID=A0A166Y0P0_9GAMM|nr:hypothetical protein [Pseudoalteromonas luteoviolacea]KZN41227.1 hypothetical protein N482_20400 [Pseudoalteromonas luteoviolacea NCIMB 1942]KZX00506.1 hypothetical protein JL49_11505 [Pseudoalteromonas luteoviolacea]
MGTALQVTTPYSRFRASVYRALHRPYLVACLISYVIIVMLVIVYLQKAPTYKSDLDIVLPGTGANSQVSIDEVGQVVSSTSAPFGKGYNPRVNYKEMLMSRNLIENAAQSLNIHIRDFGNPKIRLTEQTSILNVETTANSAKMAQQKAWALYDALQAQLDHLRADEVKRRDESIKAVLDQYRERLNATRNNIIDFQQRSLLVSGEQLLRETATLATIKERMVMIQAEIGQSDDYVNQLSVDLGVSPAMAGQAFVLQSDGEFRGYLSELTSSASQLSEYRSRWGDGHPKVKAEFARFEQSKQSLRNRSQGLVGPNAAHIFTSLDLKNNPKRAQLFADLINAYALNKGKQAQFLELDQAQVLLNEKIKIYAREAAELERLEREFDLAEAVFTSAAARLEAGKADVFASYPIVQLMTPPSVAMKPVSPKKSLAVAAALFAMIFTSAAILMVNKRREIVALVVEKPKAKA